MCIRDRPRVMHTAVSDSDKAAAVRRVSGCLESVRPETLRALCASESRVLARALLSACSLDLHDSKISDASAAGIEQLALASAPAPFRWPWRHFNEGSVEAAVQDMLRSLGGQAPLIPVMDFLLAGLTPQQGTAALAPSEAAAVSYTHLTLPTKRIV
eukprot:TRINITY_DN16553_c0_g2_i2.p1 TRINITY_DN16553_c0_g2~~TRINITY_DN16553_c0_g2_i2.p1  ORF type:complete len:157 (-),score=37.38 TRINITY_DN16553_c0_g2_i2:97-567(-)